MEPSLTPTVPPGRRRRTLSVALLPLALLLSGASFRPADETARRLAPPEVYRAWWAATEQCAGKTARFERMEWYVRDGFDFPCPTGRCVGRWEPRHRIYIASRWQQHEMVVRHEMLHAILGTGDHPSETFEQKCGVTWETWMGGKK